MLAPHLLLKPSASVNTCEPSRVARLSDLLLHYFHYLILLLRKTFIITELGIKELAQRGGSGVLLGSICGSREVFFSRRSHLQGKVKIEPVRGVEGMKGGVNIHPVLFVSVAVVGSSPKIHIRAGLCLQETTEQRGLEGNADWSCWFKIYLFNTCSDGEQRQNTDSKQEEVPVTTTWEKSKCVGEKHSGRKCWSDWSLPAERLRDYRTDYQEIQLNDILLHIGNSLKFPSTLLFNVSVAFTRWWNVTEYINQLLYMLQY